MTKNVYLTGDVMCDSVLHYSNLAQKKINLNISNKIEVDVEETKKIE